MGSYLGFTKPTSKKQETQGVESFIRSSQKDSDDEVGRTYKPVTTTRKTTPVTTPTKTTIITEIPATKVTTPTPSKVMTVTTSSDVIHLGGSKPTTTTTTPTTDVIRLGTPTPTPKKNIFQKVTSSVGSFIQSGKQQALGSLERAETKIIQVLDPSKAKRDAEIKKVESQASKEVKAFNKESELVGQQIKNFNTKYQGELSAEDYTRATKELEAIETNLKNLKAKEERFGLGSTTYLGGARTPFEKELEAKRNAIIKKEKANTGSFSIKGIQQNISGIGTGIALAPIGILRAELQPKKTLETAKALSPLGIITPKGRATLRETGKGVAKEFAQDPFRATGEIAGTFLVQEIAGAGLSKALTKVKTIKKTTTIKPKVSQSFSIDEAIKIAPNQYKVTGKVITKVKDSKGKLLETIKSQTYTDVTTAKTEAGAIKSFSKTTADSLRRGGLQHSQTEPKLTLKLSKTKGSGEMTFTPVDENLAIGSGEFGIKEVGTVKYKAQLQPKNIFRIDQKTSKLKAPRQSEAISQVAIKRLGKTDAVKSKKGVDVFGTRTFYKTKSITDVTPTTFKVKGYRRQSGKYIQTQTRKYPTQQKPLRTTEDSFSTTFKPKEIVFDFGEAKITQKVKTLKKPEPSKFDIFDIDYKPTSKPTSKGLKLGTVQKGILTEKKVAKLSAKELSKATTLSQVRPKTKTVKIRLISQPKIKLYSLGKAGFITRQLIKPTQQYNLKLESKTRLNAQLKQQGQIRQRERITQLNKAMLTQDTRLRQQTQQKQRQRVRQQQVSKTRLTPPRINPPNVNAFGLPRFKAPSGKGGGFYFKSKKEDIFGMPKTKQPTKKMIRQQKLAYTRSVGATLLGLKAGKRKKGRKFSGLELRG